MAKVLIIDKNEHSYYLIDKTFNNNDSLDDFQIRHNILNNIYFSTDSTEFKEKLKELYKS